MYCGSLVNRDSCCQFSRHQNALDRHTGAKGVTTLCSSVSKSVRQTASSAFRVPKYKSQATEVAIVIPLTVASMQQKRGSEVRDVPQEEEEAASTVLLRLGPSQVVETPSSQPGETVGRRALGTDLLYVASEEMAYDVLSQAGKWPVGRLKLLDEPAPRPVVPVKKN